MKNEVSLIAFAMEEVCHNNTARVIDVFNMP